jgi:hypothetical protein
MSLANTIIYGDIQQIQPLLESHPDLDHYDEYGYTPLIEAVIAGKLDIAKYLLANGAGPNFPDTTTRTALHWAVDNNHIALATLLLDQGANPNAYTSFSQPILVMPLLRRQKKLINLLLERGADLNFAKDYIHAKLLAHRFSLTTKVDIVNARGQFVELNLEGFIPQATVLIIADSLYQFAQHFAAREFRDILPHTDKILDAFHNASALLQLQHYNTNLSHHRKKIGEILSKKLLFLPIAYRGHAIGIARLGNLFAKCDRGEYGKQHGSLQIFQITKPAHFTQGFLQQLFFNRTNKEFVHEKINDILGLKAITTLSLPLQLVGNCSWANVEGSVMALLYLLLASGHQFSLEQCQTRAVAFHEAFLAWDKRRALDETIDAFYRANPARKASIAALLAIVLFQTCSYENNQDFETTEKIAQVFRDKRYHYVLRSYLNIHYDRYHNDAGKNLHELLEIIGLDLAEDAPDV